MKNILWGALGGLVVFSLGFFFLVRLNVLNVTLSSLESRFTGEVVSWNSTKGELKLMREGDGFIQTFYINPLEMSVLWVRFDENGQEISRRQLFRTDDIEWYTFFCNGDRVTTASRKMLTDEDYVLTKIINRGQRQCAIDYSQR